jgi:opacity protein-like surface antigen
MKKPFLAALLSCAASMACFAQETVNAIHQEDAAAQPATGISGAPLRAGLFSEAIAPITFSVPFSAAAAKPEPRVVPRREDYDHWQLGFAYTYFRFRSAPLTANLNGIDSSLAYMMDERYGIEGSVSAAFSTLLPGFPQEHAKLVTFMGGPRFVWPRQKWEPWAHVLVGGAHLQPQTAAGGRAAFAYCAGGGVDYHLISGVSIRMQGNWVGSRFFSQNQNSIQIAAGVLLHF